MSGCSASGAPRRVCLVPDNLKSGVNKASFYDPEVNRTYGTMAAHYNVGILPARPRKPKDKAAVEAGVRFAQSYILGRLRHVTFFSLAECNAAIAAALERMNGREMRRLGVSRRQLFETVERPVMQPLPEQDYEYADWHLARVGIDYHVEVQGFFYSVPHALIREQVDTRATARTIEMFHRGKRVAAHARRYGGPRHGTLPDHMPSAHRRYAEWTPERFQRQARDIGPNTEALIIAVLARRPHPEQGFRTCLGVLRLFRGIDRRPGRGGQPARDRDRRAVLRLRRLDPQTPARPERRRRKPRTARRCCTTTSAAPATSIEETTLLNHPTLDRLRELGLDGMAKRFQDLAANPESRALDHAEWLGLLLEQESHAAPAEALREPRADRQAAPCGRGRGCRLPHAARSRPHAVPAPGQLRLDPRAPALSDHRPMRRRQVVAGLRAGRQGLPGESVGALSAHAAAVRRSGAGAR